MLLEIQIKQTCLHRVKNENLLNMNDKKNELGAKIRTLRELKGVSQEAIARCLGISQQAFQKIETGKTKLNFARISLIAVELNIELETLINFNPDNFLLQNADTAKDLSRNTIFEPFQYIFLINALVALNSHITDEVFFTLLDSDSNVQ